MALRCSHGMIRGLCVQPNCSHSDHGKIPRIEQTGVQVSTRKPKRFGGSVRVHSDADMVAALDRAETLLEAARKLDCSIQAFYMRARTSEAVSDAMQRRRDRGHVRGRRRRPCSPINESKAQVIERVRVHAPSSPDGALAPAAARARDLANLTQVQSSRPLAPPGRRAP